MTLVNSIDLLPTVADTAEIIRDITEGRVRRNVHGASGKEYREAFLLAEHVLFTYYDEAAVKAKEHGGYPSYRENYVAASTNMKPDC